MLRTPTQRTFAAMHAHVHVSSPELTILCFAALVPAGAEAAAGCSFSLCV